MSPTPAETNSPVLLDQARRYVDAEDGRVGGLQTRAASLLAAVVVLVGLTFTVESQFSDRNVSRWISLSIAVVAMGSLIVGARSFLRVLAPRRIDRDAPQTISVLSAPGFVDTPPTLLTQQLIGTLAGELDAARSEVSQIQRALQVGARWLAAGVVGVFALAVLFGATHDKTPVQRIKLVAPVDVHVDAPIQARIVTPVQARIVAPLHATIEGQVRTKIVAPVTIIGPDEDPWPVRTDP